MTNIIKNCAILKYLTVQTCTALIPMLCITHLDYTNAILYGLPKSTLRKYQTIQNMCAKLVFNKDKYSGYIISIKEITLASNMTEV